VETTLLYNLIGEKSGRVPTDLHPRLAMAAAISDGSSQWLFWMSTGSRPGFSRGFEMKSGCTPGAECVLVGSRRIWMACAIMLYKSS
jgi:hypothetical protein